MRIPAIKNRFVSFVLIATALVLRSPLAYAAPCEGKGTIIFFVNGVFNDRGQAKDNLAALKSAVSPELSEIQNLKYDLAWVEGGNKILQLAMAVAQRGIDDFQRFWLWRDGMDEAPSWFNELVESTVLTPVFLDVSIHPRIREHLELYSDAILKGYQVIIVSHSSGNFYANAVLRALPEYVPAALQPSILDRTKKNSNYPKADEMISNIQIGSPVKETVNQSPLITFKDDQIVNWVRRLAGALSGNIDASGASAADLRAHSLAQSYLRVRESRSQIVRYIKSAYRRMKYPIPFFDSAATIEYMSVLNGKSTPSFSAAFWAGRKEITEVNERSIEQGNRYVDYVARCYGLGLGTIDMRADSIAETGSSRDFKAVGYAGDASTRGQALIMRNQSERERWNLGKIDVTPGKMQNPIEVRVRYFERPRNARGSD